MSVYIMDLWKPVGLRTIMQCAADNICMNQSGHLLTGRLTDAHNWKS